MVSIIINKGEVPLELEEMINRAEKDKQAFSAIVNLEVEKGKYYLSEMKITLDTSILKKSKDEPSPFFKQLAEKINVLSKKYKIKLSDQEVTNEMLMF